MKFVRLQKNIEGFEIETSGKETDQLHQSIGSNGWPW